MYVSLASTSTRVILASTDKNLHQQKRKLPLQSRGQGIWLSPSAKKYTCPSIKVSRTVVFLPTLLPFSASIIISCGLSFISCSPSFPVLPLCGASLPDVVLRRPWKVDEGWLQLAMSRLLVTAPPTGKFVSTRTVL